MPVPNTSGADAAAVAGTNNGALDWRTAHENWTRESRESLSPSAFAKRVMDLGGGRNVKDTESFGRSPQPKGSIHTSQAPTKILERAESFGRNQQPGDSTQSSQAQTRYPERPESFGRIQQPNGSMQSSHLQTRSPERPMEVGFDRSPDIRTLQNELHHTKGDIGRIDRRLDQLLQSINNLHEAVEEIAKQRQAVHSSRDDSATVDLLAETVSTIAPKVGEIDGLRLALDSCRRRLNRLEGREKPADAEPLPTLNSTPFPAVANAPGNQGFALSKRATEHGIGQQTVYRGVPDQNINTFTRISSQLHPRKRGRPPKQAPTYLVDGIRSLSTERVGFRANSPSAERNAEIHSPIELDQGRVVRRGSGVGFSHDSTPLKRERQKPTRLPDGTLLRKNGLPDKRSANSAQNLRKISEKRKYSHEAEASDETKERPQATTGSTIGAVQLPPMRDHETVMRHMFPKGLHEDARRIDHAGKIFSADRAPQHETVQPRREMQIHAAERPSPQSSASSFTPVNAPPDYGLSKA